MTIEEKAKAYDETFERARVKHAQFEGMLPGDVLEDVFPELKESEDEKIREELIDYLKERKSQEIYVQYVLKFNRWLEWLEKQGSQNLANSAKTCKDEQNLAWSEEDEPQKELAETYLAVFDKKFPILPTLKGKQLADYKNFLNKCQQILGLKYWGLRPLQAKLFEKLSLLWAAWGAEHLKGLGQTDGDTDNEKQEWSEEDEHRVKDTIYFLDTAKKHYASTVEIDACVDWLKSLKERYTWKPSDEQMKLLREVQQALLGKDCHNRFTSFVHDLKKL